MGARPVLPRAFARSSRHSSFPTGRALRARRGERTSRGGDRRANRVVFEPQITKAVAPPLAVSFALQTVVDDAPDARRRVAADVVAEHVVGEQEISGAPEHLLRRRVR